MDSIATTRIDLQKLQLLNDRICQCLDALNQVRLSAHAPSFGATVPYGGIGAFGYGAPVFGQPSVYPQAPIFGAFPPAFAPNYGYGMGVNTGFSNIPAYPAIPHFGHTPVPHVMNPWQGLGPVGGVFGHTATPNGQLSSTYAPNYSMAW